MTTPDQHHPYVGARLDPASLQGEVTLVAKHLRDTSDFTPQQLAIAWITGTLDETAHVVRAMLYATVEERAQLIVDLQNAADALHQLAVGGDDGG